MISFYTIVYLVFYTVFTCGYLGLVRKLKRPAALTILAELMAGSFVLVFIPFFELDEKYLLYGIISGLTIVAPLCSLTVFLTIIVSCIFLDEKNELKKKFFSGLLVIIGIIIINRKGE